MNSGYNKNKSEVNLEELEEIIVTSEDETGVIHSYWSPTLFPPLKITTNNVTREIKVTFASVENDDKQLLHKLLTKTRAIM